MKIHLIWFYNMEYTLKAGINNLSKILKKMKNLNKKATIFSEQKRNLKMLNNR